MILILMNISIASPGFSAPITPTVLVAAEHERVYLFWDNLAESSIDSLTGYSDFEGYRIYKSTDGGITWGGPDDKIYDWDRNFVGWRPIAQFDLTFAEDSLHCVYINDECSGSDPIRGIGIFGNDPYQPAISLGNNSGLRYSFSDDDVVDGIEYTYAVTSYDMGLRTYEIIYNQTDSNFVADTVWSPSNPDHFTSTDGENGIASLESPMGSSVDDKNFVKIIPGYYASNITFPDDVSDFFLRQEGTLGTGDITYDIVDTKQLSSDLYIFEVQADHGVTSVDGMNCENPKVYIYEVVDSLDRNPVAIAETIAITGLDSLTIDSLLDFPGAYQENDEVNIPAYTQIIAVDERSAILDGIQFEYHNIPWLIPAPLVVEELEWHADSSVINLIDLKFDTDQGKYEKRLNFDYKLEFFSTSIGDTVINHTNQMTPLPFRITNLSTGRKVGLKHNDYGVTFPPPLVSLGYGDNSYTINEKLLFERDTLMVDGEESEVVTYNLIIDFDPPMVVNNYMLQHGFSNVSQVWLDDETYRDGDLVGHKAMVWVAQKTHSGFEPSIDFIDNNGDGVNDNPWRTVYPWNDGDYVIIRPKKFFTDGDNWLVDMSALGKSHKVSESELSEIQVVPNPFIVRSGFLETATDFRMRFIQLPQHCRISIYTVTGELVNSFEHNNVYNGNAWWDLRSKSGKLVAPGLYIYVVESDDQKHIGKFSVVR